MRKVIFILFCFSTIQAIAQEEKSSLTAILFDYTHQFPMGDLAETFGDNSSIGISLIKKRTNNWLFGIDGSYVFGSKIKAENLFNGIATENGEIINKDGLFANVMTFERGFSTFLAGGRAFTFSENNESGIYLISGIGYMQHKIRIQTQEDFIPHLDDEYKKGYDRLSGGVSVKLNVNYMYFSKKNNIKFFAGMELIKGWTKNLRAYDFNQMQHTSDEIKNDIKVGVKVGFIIPIFKRNIAEFHYR